jgi:hypothetical protein
MNGSRKIKPQWKPIAVALVLLAGVGISAADRQSSVQLEPERTAIRFTLGSVLHTVHGTFCLKHGAWRLDPAPVRLTGEIVVDTQSGRERETERGSGKRRA